MMEDRKYRLLEKAFDRVYEFPLKVVNIIIDWVLNLRIFRIITELELDEGWVRVTHSKRKIFKVIDSYGTSIIVHDAKSLSLAHTEIRRLKRHYQLEELAHYKANKLTSYTGFGNYTLKLNYILDVIDKQIPKTPNHLDYWSRSVLHDTYY